jgi:hypothetical protein
MSCIRAAANYTSLWAKLRKMDTSHRLSSCGRLSVFLGTVLVLAFTSVQAQVQPPMEVIAFDYDVIVEGAPGTRHAGPLMILSYLPCEVLLETKVGWPLRKV